MILYFISTTLFLETLIFNVASAIPLLYLIISLLLLPLLLAIRSIFSMSSSSALNVIMHSIENIERKLTLLELRIKENEIKMKEFMDSVDNRISDMELTLQELQEPVIEPEFIEAKPRRTRKIRTRQI